jgi:hypothetical protein
MSEQSAPDTPRQLGQGLSDRLSSTRRQLRDARHRACIAALVFTGLNVEFGFDVANTEGLNHNVVTDWKTLLLVAVVDGITASNLVNQSLRCVNLGSEVAALSIAEAIQVERPEAAPTQAPQC